MVYSDTCRYALRAVTRIASQPPSGFVLLTDICAGTDLPRPFIAGILHRLVRARLSTSSQRRSHGLALAKPAAAIRVRDIVAVVDGAQGLEQGLLGLGDELGPKDGKLRHHWSRIRRHIDQEMLDVTLQRVVRRAGRNVRSGPNRHG